jgi:hypothetical protein
MFSIISYLKDFNVLPLPAALMCSKCPGTCISYAYTCSFPLTRFTHAVVLLRSNKPASQKDSTTEL